MMHTSVPQHFLPDPKYLLPLSEQRKLEQQERAASLRLYRCIREQRQIAYRRRFADMSPDERASVQESLAYIREVVQESRVVFARYNWLLRNFEPEYETLFSHVRTL